MKTTEYCDNCGEEWDGSHVVTELSSPVASANAGESAILCQRCTKD